MKTLSTSIFIMLFSIATYAQDQIKITDRLIYEIGDEIISCESNFKNLFNNWTNKNIENADQTTLISYKLIDTIKNYSQIEYYASQIGNIEAPWQDILRLSSSDDKGIVISKIIFNVTTAKDIYESRGANNEQFLSELNTNMHNIKKLLITQNIIKVGDKIFLIKVKSKGKIYDNYVVCDADTFKVKWDNLFNFPI